MLYEQAAVSQHGKRTDSQLNVGGVHVVADDGDAGVGDEVIDALRVRLFHLLRGFLCENTDAYCAPMSCRCKELLASTILHLN